MVLIELINTDNFKYEDEIKDFLKQNGYGKAEHVIFTKIWFCEKEGKANSNIKSFGEYYNEDWIRNIINIYKDFGVPIYVKGKRII